MLTQDERIAIREYLDNFHDDVMMHFGWEHYNFSKN